MSLRLLLASCLALTACHQPTTFTGAPKFPDGVAGCRAACARDGLVFGGFVYSGDFATSCVCQAPGAAPAQPTSGEANPTAGVVIQTQAAAAAAASSQRYRQQLSTGSMRH